MGLSNGLREPSAPPARVCQRDSQVHEAVYKIIGVGTSNLGLACGVQPWKPEHREYRINVSHKLAIDGDLYLLDEDGHPYRKYARILIQKENNK